MRCSNCDFENPEGMKFCGQCGSPLIKQCSNCGFTNPPGFKFCGECGTSLQGDSPVDNSLTAPKQATAQTRKTQSAERRQLTVMFCDLVGSTALSEQLDPEELREVIRIYQQTAAKVISRFDGYIAQFLGDGLLVYFGYPAAHENDARRAVLAGLGIMEEMAQLDMEFAQTLKPVARPQIRLGIHTGLVVVGEIGDGNRREQLALGETTNIAARLQGMAEPDTLVISPITYRLVQGFFTCRPLGAQALRGISQPMEVYRVLNEGEARTRLDAAMVAATGLTPLVGRQAEVELLLARWEQAKAGRGQIVVLEGEAGIGKSRLVQVLKEHLIGDPHIWLDCYTQPYYQNSALYPIIEMFQRLLRFTGEDTVEQKLNKMETVLGQYGLPLPETVPLFAALLSLPMPERYPPLNLTAQRQKQKSVEALLTILSRLTDMRPVVITIEDLHWADPSTLEMLDILVNQVPNTRILTVFTFRSEFICPWLARPYLSQITLTRLPGEEVELIVKRIAGGKELPAELLRQIVAKTDGVPIFVEELTKMVLELEWLAEYDDHYELVGQLPDLAIPATLQDSLMARLDRLATVREVTQLGATLGREFSYELLWAISPFDETTLKGDLVRLVEAELLYQSGVPPQVSYTFRHALIQEAAYRSLLRRKRQQYHRQIAQVLAEQFPEVAQTEPELLAHHYTVAGLNQQAITYWQRAGQRAFERSANIEAIHHFNKGLDLLESLPKTPEFIEQELHLKVALSAALSVTKGYASAEVEVHYARARALCQELGNVRQLAPVLYGLWVFYLVRAQYQTALEVGQRLLRLAEQSPDDSTLSLEAHQVQGINFFFLGELILAREHLEQAITLYNPQQHGLEVSVDSGADRGVTALAHLGLTLWLLGYPDQALRRCEEAIVLAKGLSHPYSIAFALVFAAWLHQYRREGHLAQERVRAALKLSEEQGFALLGAFGVILEGWAMTEQGDTEAGITQILDGLANFRATGAELGLLHFLALLAEAHGKVGQFEEGLAVLTGALVAVKETGERFYEAELYRLQGDLLVNQAVHAGGPADLFVQAETSFRRAIDIATQQQATSPELRATMSLSRLYQQQGQIDNACQILNLVYNKFTEGFDTVDLTEANALLETMLSTTTRL